MDKNKLFVISAQCAMFFDPQISIDKDGKIDLLKNVSSKCGKLLDGEPTILPIPLEAPADIPRVQLNSKDKSYTYGISLKRSDLSFNEISNPNKTLDAVSPTLFKYEKDLLNVYQNEKHWKVSRLAFIVNYVIDLNDSVERFISKNFISKAPSYSSIELDLLKKGKINTVDINRWFRMKPAGNKKNILHLLVDVNTLAEKKLELPVNDLMRFYDSIVAYVNKEIKDMFGELFK